MHTIDFMELYVDLQITHPLVLLCMAIAFVFSFVLSLLIFFLLFTPHRTISKFLFVVLFFLTTALSIGTLHLSYNYFVTEASSVGVAGFAGNLIFLFVPFVCGLALSYCLFKKRNRKY